MSHLDTAYKLGALKAMEDFKAELLKQSQQFAAGGAAGGKKILPERKPIATPPPARPGFVNPDRTAGTKKPSWT